MLKLISLLAALSLGVAAFAQTASTAAQQAQLLAPQLLAFSGSSANFESLVSGLTAGLPVTLATTNADGSLQVVTFAPTTALSVTDAVQILEAARQSLIGRGIAVPTAQQLAIALMGGALPTALGATPVTGVLSGNAGTTTPIQVRTELPASAGASTNLSQANLLALRSALQLGTAATLTGANGSVTFTAPGGPMSAAEANQALTLATALLAQQGIVNPTAEQLQAALLGGSIGGVTVQGVLQGRLANTSNSRLFGTSDSRTIGTSNTPAATGTTTTPGTTGAAGASTSRTTGTGAGMTVPRTATGATPSIGARR